MGLDSKPTRQTLRKSKINWQSIPGTKGVSPTGCSILLLSVRYGSLVFDADAAVRDWTDLCL